MHASKLVEEEEFAQCGNEIHNQVVVGHILGITLHPCYVMRKQMDPQFIYA